MLKTEWKYVLGLGILLLAGCGADVGVDPIKVNSTAIDTIAASNFDSVDEDVGVDIESEIGFSGNFSTVVLGLGRSGASLGDCDISLKINQSAKIFKIEEIQYQCWNGAIGLWANLSLEIRKPGSSNEQELYYKKNVVGYLMKDSSSVLIEVREWGQDLKLKIDKNELGEFMLTSYELTENKKNVFKAMDVPVLLSRTLE